MKKRIKDLTLTEIKDMCLRNHCLYCPLRKYKCVGALDMWLEAKDDDETTNIYFSVLEILNSTHDILNELKRS